jgi:DNA-directed RNA polymerase sigma subunit (sigma70/sigma32)
MRDSRVLRPPQKYRQYKRLIQSNPYITDEELIEELHTTVGELSKIKAYQQPLSIDVPLNDEDSDSLKDLIPTAHYSLEDEVTEQVFEDSKKEVWNIIADNTSDKANRCIQGYYKYGKTYKEIADIEGGVSPSGIRELINTNLKALKRGKVAKILKTKFMEVEATMYHGSITSFKYTDSSIQEKIVLRKEYYRSRYKAE